MTIVASVRQTASLRADLPAATAALAQIATNRPNSTNLRRSTKPHSAKTYLIIPRSSIKQPAAFTTRLRDSLARHPKSP
jgi:hypothetical protein